MERLICPPTHRIIRITQTSAATVFPALTPALRLCPSHPRYVGQRIATQSAAYSLIRGQVSMTLLSVRLAPESVRLALNDHQLFGCFAGQRGFGVGQKHLDDARFFDIGEYLALGAELQSRLA